ncbi:MAG: hypothetical protein HKM02_07740 [Pseudomonadales bacterium]|nr:hypothetical protein [Pseudomonadales bacterium]
MSYTLEEININKAASRIFGREVCMDGPGVPQPLNMMLYSFDGDKYRLLIDDNTVYKAIWLYQKDRERVESVVEGHLSEHLPVPSIQFAEDMNDYVNAKRMYEAFTRHGFSMCYKNLNETRAMHQPSMRAENWFLTMIELGRNHLTDDEKALVLDDRYAEAIIGNRQDEYDALEIHGVRNLYLPGDSRGTCCEVDEDNPQFFSVYVHAKAGGIECVGDFATHNLARSYAKELADKYQYKPM